MFGISPVEAVRAAAVLARRAAALVLGWGVAEWDYILPESLTVSQAAARARGRGRHGGAFRGRARRGLQSCPPLVLLYMLDQKSLLPGRRRWE